MDFFEAISSVLNNYVNFQTRAIRSEFWLWYLFVFILGIVVAVIELMIGGYLSFILALALFLPHLAVMVRRLHDTDRSGWWILLALIPLIGGIVLLVWFCTRGTMGANRFGPDPLEG